MTPADFRAFRLALGYTQERLAEVLGMHPNTIACMERGDKPISRRTVAALALLEDVTGVDA